MARTMDPASKATFPPAEYGVTDSASHWPNGSDNWYSVYQWINSQDHGDSIRSSTSSQPQTSPSSGVDDHEHPLLCDTPNSPVEQPSSLFFSNNNNNNKMSEFDLNSTWFNPPISSVAPAAAAPVEKKPEKENNSDYALLTEILRYNMNNPSPPAVTSPPAPISTNPIFSSASTSTSSPWSLPPDDPPLYRSLSQGVPQGVPQGMFWNPPNSRHNSTDADLIQVLSNQLAACTVQQQVNPQPSGVDLTYIMQQQAIAAQQQHRQWQPKVVYQRHSMISALHAKVDEVTDEYRQLEKERKQTEAELARHNLGKKISSSNGLPIPKLPNAPSRIDRMVVDFFREHARISTLLAKMEQLTGMTMPRKAHVVLTELLDSITHLYHSRVHERTLILQQLRGEPMLYDEEKEAGIIIDILCHVQKAATRVRAANWFCLMTTLGPLDANQRMQMDQIITSDFTIPPPPIRPRPV